MLINIQKLLMERKLFTIIIESNKNTLRAKCQSKLQSKFKCELKQETKEKGGEGDIDICSKYRSTSKRCNINPQQLSQFITYTVVRSYMRISYRKEASHPRTQNNR